jgi:shikimate kinase
MNALHHPDEHEDHLSAKAEPDSRAQAILKALGARSIVLVGLMGAGKSSVGRRLALALGVPFCDADTEIEIAATMTIAEIFERFGETHFRDREAAVISRLLQNNAQVLATGGGAFMSSETRAAIDKRGVSLWLKADLETLMKRVRRRSDRPLLKNTDPEGTMKKLIDQRYPVYAQADITVVSIEGPHEQTVEATIKALQDYLVEAH